MIFSFSISIILYIIQFVCLFVCLSVRLRFGQNYCTERHQTLRDYKVGLRECPPRVEIARLAVLEEISFYFRFFILADAILLIIALLTSGRREQQNF